MFIGRDPSCEMVRSSSTLTNAGIEIIKTLISETLTCGLVSPLLRSLTVLKNKLIPVGSMEMNWGKLKTRDEIC